MIFVINHTFSWNTLCNLASSGQHHINLILKTGAAQVSVRYEILLVHMPCGQPFDHIAARSKQPKIPSEIADRQAGF